MAPTLRADQMQGVRIIENAFLKQKGFCLADKPGLGKTAQAIEVMKRIGGQAQIICPAYLVYNWLDELALWGIDRNDVHVIDSSKQSVKIKAPVYLSSYDMAVNPMIKGQLLPMRKNLIICDEAHTFRSWNTKRSRYIMGTNQNKVKHYRNFTEHLLLLTGTPVVNGVEDAYNIFSRLAPDLFSAFSKKHFMQYFSAEVFATDWGLKYKGIAHADELRKALKPYLLCRSIAGDLPPLITKTILLPAKKADLKELFEQESAFLLEHGINEGDIISLKAVSGDEHFSTVRQRVAITKIPAAVRMVLELVQDGERPIVYTYHKAVQAALRDALQKKCGKRRIEIINGDTPLETRHELVKAYQAGDVDILLPTIGALKEGVNLTSGKYLLFVEMPYTPAEVEQVQARLHRAGQQNTVHSIILAYDGGIDKHIAGILKTKQGIIQQIITVSEADPFEEAQE